MVDWVSFGLSITSLIISVIISGIGIVVAYLTLLSRINPLLEIEYIDNEFYVKNIGRGFVYNLSGEFISLEGEVFSILFIYTLSVNDERNLILFKKTENLDFLKEITQEELEEKQDEIINKFMEFKGNLVGYIKYRNEFGLKRKSYFIIGKNSSVCRRVNKRYYKYWVKYIVHTKGNLTIEDYMKQVKKLSET